MAFEVHLYQYADSRHPAVLAEIRDKKELDDTLRAQLDELIRAAKAEFAAARGNEAA
jgi:F0F1-type ATP synthase alpha subunit